ncbi:retrovirus-related Pol polyprotein from transposon 412 [Trichonephila clavipes]|nr:retrovirus-related Pol polyprotein from transposon 412 [Trichonephila clavipes]
MQTSGDSQTKACQLAASLRADAADILQTLPETQRLDFDALVNALELRFERNVKQTGRRPLNAGPAVEKGICREAAGHAKALKLISAFQKEVSGKLVNDHLVGRKLPDFGKPHIPVCQISTKSTDRDGEKIDIHGKLKVKIRFGDTTYQHAVYVADIADPFILGLDFLKEHGFTLDFNKNELRSIHEEVTIFKIKHRTESIRQVTANENITIPPRTEIIVPGYIGNDVSFNSGLIGTAENKANGLLIASTLVDLSRKTIPVRICNVTEKPRVFQKGEVLATCSPVTCVCKKFELALSNSPQQLTPDLLENAELSPEQKSSAERLFQEFEDVFSRNSSDIGHTTVTQHRIDTADHPPIKQHPRRLPFAKQEEVGTLLREMQENDIIEPSSSPWASPIVLVRKKDGSTRFCVDYRKLNDVTKKDSYPLPRIDDTLDTLSGHKWFSTLDLKSGYWQVEIHPEDREKQHSLPAKDMAVQSHAVRALQCASYFRAPDGDRAKGSDFKLALFTWMTS